MSIDERALLHKRIIICCFPLFASCSIWLSGCSFKSQSLPPQSYDPDRMHLSILNIDYSGQSITRKSVWQYIEDRFDVTYDLTVYPSSSYRKKMQIAITSGQSVDAAVWFGSHTEFTNLARIGTFHDLTDYVSQSEHLSEFPEEILKRASVDGRLYGLPRPRALVSQAVMIRKDWLDRLGLPLPVTTDDYYKVAAAFGQQDPDRDGKTNTYGMAAGAGLSFLHEWFVPLGAGNTWIETEDGTLMPSIISDGRREGLLWLRRLYQERGIDGKFSVLKDAQVWERFVKGITGIIIAPISDYYQYEARLRANHPEAELIMLGPAIGPTGIAGFTEGPGYYGQVVIPSKVPIEKVERIIEILDWQSSEEGYLIRNEGLEGIHRILQSDGSIVVDKTAVEDEVLGSIYLINPDDPYLYVARSAPEEIQQRQREMLDLVRDLGIANPALSYLSTIGAATGTLYADDIQSFESKLVKGDRPESDLEVFRREWLARGGEQYRKEVNEWYSQERSLTP